MVGPDVAFLLYKVGLLPPDAVKPLILLLLKQVILTGDEYFEGYRRALEVACNYFTFNDYEAFKQDGRTFHRLLAGRILNLDLCMVHQDWMSLTEYRLLQCGMILSPLAFDILKKDDIDQLFAKHDSIEIVKRNAIVHDSYIICPTPDCHDRSVGFRIRCAERHLVDKPEAPPVLKVVELTDMLSEIGWANSLE